MGMDPARRVGINHVALEVGSSEEALAFYGRFFELHLRGVVPGMNQSEFRTAAENAKGGCPVSRALEGNVAVELDARLDTA